MDCKTASVLMLKYMDMVLTEKEAKELCIHVADCESCGYDFSIYKEMTAEFEAASASLLEPPEGFTECVMSAVYKINVSYGAYSQDAVTGVIFGVFSMLFGVGVMLSAHSTEIAEFMKGYPTLTKIINTIETTSESVSSFLDNAVFMSLSWFNGAYALLESAKYGILTIVAGLLAAQYVLYSKSKVKI